MSFYIDGQSVGNEQKGQPRKARIAIVYRPSSTQLPGSSAPMALSEDVGDKTNNEAEYHALLRLLSLLSTRGGNARNVGPVRIFADSKLLVNQVNGEWKVEEERLGSLREEARSLMNRLGPITLEWIPRDKNYAGLWLEGKWTVKQVRAEQFLSGLSG